MHSTLKELGEHGFLQFVSKFLPKDPSIIRTFSEDCAVIEGGNGKYRIFTTDALIENVHFKRAYAEPFLIGRKALSVNLSDIAAMGGTPVFYMVSLAAPPETTLPFIAEIYRGMDSVARDHGVLLIGGNVSAAAEFSLHIFVVGEVAAEKVVFRSTARPDDLLFVTGVCGISAAGLAALQSGLNSRTAPAALSNAIKAHLDPVAQIEAGKILAESGLITAMMDTSDGLAADIPKLCEQSSVGAEIFIDKIPAPELPDLSVTASIDLAFNGGEDYHLLFTASPENKNKIQDLAARSGFSAFEIGRLTAGREILLIDRQGKRSPAGKGFEHFSN